jgi:hypothetical protein
MAKEKTRLGLFDHISAVTEKQDPNYFNTISVEDKKTWTNYLIFRYLSMNYDFVEFLAEIQPLVETLEAEQFYKVMIDVIPKKKYYLKYMKGKKSADYEKWLIELVAKDNQVSTLQAEEYLDILYSTKNGKGEILNLCQKYGTPEKEISSLKLKI